MSSQTVGTGWRFPARSSPNLKIDLPGIRFPRLRYPTSSHRIAPDFFLCKGECKLSKVLAWWTRTFLLQPTILSKPRPCCSYINHRKMVFERCLLAFSVGKHSKLNAGSFENRKLKRDPSVKPQKRALPKRLTQSMLQRNVLP